MEIKRSEHKTPKVTSNEMDKRIRAACMSWYSHLFVMCEYCGGAHHKDYVCHCGYQLQYNDENQEVWSNK